MHARLGSVMGRTKVWVRLVEKVKGLNVGDTHLLELENRLRQVRPLDLGQGRGCHTVVRLLCVKPVAGARTLRRQRALSDFGWASPDRRRATHLTTGSTSPLLGGRPADARDKQRLNT